MSVGVLGVGNWGQKHVEELLRLGVDVVAADPDRRSRAACEKRFGIQTFADFRDVLSDSKVRAVTVCTPHKTHFRVAKAALMAGKHVLIEKPMTRTVWEADALLELARRKKLTLCVGHIYRFNNAIEKAKKTVKGGALGKLYNINLMWTNHERVWPDRDIVFDLGDHPLDIVMHITGKAPKSVFSNGDGFRQRNEEVAIINFHIDDVFVNVDLSWINPIKQRTMLIIGSKKSLFVDCLNQNLKLIDPKTRHEKRVPVNANNTLGDELAHFIREYDDGRSSTRVGGKRGREVIRLLELARRSILTKKEVRLSA